MILYHGTNLDIDRIDLEKCAPYKDFGKGFYTTTIFEQAKAMAFAKVVSLEEIRVLSLMRRPMIYFKTIR